MASWCGLLLRAFLINNRLTSTGGGYINPAGEDHWSILWDLIKLANDNGSELRVMLLEYGEHSQPSRAKRATQS